MLVTMNKMRRGEYSSFAFTSLRASVSSLS